MKRRTRKIIYSALALVMLLIVVAIACSPSKPATPSQQACALATRVYDSPQQQYAALAKAQKLFPPAVDIQSAVNRTMNDIKSGTSFVSDQADIDYYCEHNG
jgi:hypothetical protein